MEEKIISGHSEKIGNYIRSIIDVGEPIERSEFIEIYKRLSSGRRKGFNAKKSYGQLSRKGLVKFFVV